MKANQKQLPRESDLDRLNALIDWYEAHKPDPSRVIQVRMTPKALRKFAAPMGQDQESDPARHWRYRGVTLERLNRIAGEP